MDERAQRHAIAFAALAVVWMALRAAPLDSVPPPTWRSAVRGVHVADSPASGRLEIRGLAARDRTTGPVGTRAERMRLEAAVDLENERLATVAGRAAGRIELFPDQGVTALRLSGHVVPFYDHDSDLLQQVRQVAAERPLQALESLRQVLDARLSEPDNSITFEESTARRDLGRLLRDLEEAVRTAHENSEAALVRFRQEAAAGAVRAEGPFHRRGTWRLVELILAALLGVTLRESLRTGRRVQPLITVPFAPVLATGVVLALEGTRFLPVDPVAGTAAAFVPLAFILGVASPSLLEAVGRLDRPSPEPTRPRPYEAAPPPPRPARTTGAAAGIGPAPRRLEPEAPRPAPRPVQAAPAVTPAPEARLPEASMPEASMPEASMPEAPAPAPSPAPEKPSPEPAAPRSERELADVPFFSRPRPERRAPDRLPFQRRERHPS